MAGTYIYNLKGEVKEIGLQWWNNVVPLYTLYRQINGFKI